MRETKFSENFAAKRKENSWSLADSEEESQSEKYGNAKGVKIVCEKSISNLNSNVEIFVNKISPNFHFFVYITF